jgi:microcystin degradation protein MlrC
MRIAVGQISCESNTFATFRCDLETVRTTGYLLEGSMLFDLRGTDNEVPGMCAALDREADAEIVPLMATRWNSSWVLQADAHAHLRSLLLGRLKDAGPVDGVLLSCHGSMVATDSNDPEGWLAASVREIVGPAVPMAMTLDLHGNVTDLMVQNIDLIVGYQHYPHDDCFTTGERATQLLVRTVGGAVRPTMCRVRLPMILTASHAGILSVSTFHVGSYVDLPEMGCSTLVIADGDPDCARREAETLARQYWASRNEYLVETVSVAEAIERGRAIDGGPVLLLNTADTTGGGAAGDSIDAAAGMVAAGVNEPALAMVVDPAAAAACHAAGLGQAVRLRIGHRVDPRWGEPVDLEGKVIRLSDGRFRYSGGIFGGTEGAMGPSAVVEIGMLRLLVMSRSTYDWADEQYRSMGLDASTAKWVEAKNMMNYRHAYGAVMRGAFVLDAPGPTPPDMRALPFVRAERPWFPMDDIHAPRFANATHSY